MFLKYKVGASVTAVRRGGGLTAVDTMNHFLLNKEVIIAGSTYWNMVYGKFTKVLSRSEAEILIWERGAGFTLASGSSSCAVASVLRKMNLVDEKVKIKMLGGKLLIRVDDDWNIEMTGEVRQIAEGTLSAELIEDLNKQV